MDLNDGIYAALISGTTLLLDRAIVFLFKKKKDEKETEKISIETRVLSSGEERERSRFCEEQLSRLEDKYEEQQVRYEEQEEENAKLREKLKLMTIQLDELQRKTNETLNDITFLKTELAAYKQ